MPEKSAPVLFFWTEFANLYLSKKNFPLMTQNKNDINMGRLRSRECRLLPHSTPLAEVIQDLGTQRNLCFVVVDSGVPVGVVDASSLVQAAVSGTRMEIDLSTPVAQVATSRFLFTDTTTLLSDFLNENENLDTNYIVITDPGGACTVLTGQCHLDLLSYNSVTLRHVMPLDHFALAAIDAKATCFEALELLSREDVENLLVTDENKPRGVITRADLARVISQRRNPWKLNVLDAADRNIESLDPETPARKAAELLAEREPPYLLSRIDDKGYAMVTRRQLDRHLRSHLRGLTTQFPDMGDQASQQNFLGEVFLGQAMTDTLQMGVIALSSDLRVHYCNKAGLKLLKTNLENLLDQDAASLAPRFPVFSQVQDTAPLLSSDGPGSITLPPSTELGVNLQTKMTAIWEEGTLSGFIVTIQDVSDVDLAEVKLRKLAYYDALTGLPNRALLFERLHTEIKRCKRSGERFSLLFVDLNGFKKINDNLGHSAGDELLRQVGSRFSNLLRESDTVARLGGDEFVFILPGAQTDKQSEIVITRIRAVLEQSFSLDGHVVEVGCSVGRAIYPNNGVTPRSLIASADHSMYLEKKDRMVPADDQPAAPPVS